VLAGYDQKSNVVLSDSKERVYSIDEGVEEVPLGLYLVKGDMMCVARCAFFSALSPPRPSAALRIILQLLSSYASVLLTTEMSRHVLTMLSPCLFPASSSARSTRNVTARSTCPPSALILSRPFDTKSTATCTAFAPSLLRLP
jgi:hypothetical protein